MSQSIVSRRHALGVALALCTHPLLAAPRWAREMAQFEAEFEAGVEPGATLFLGSSSIARWHDLDADFPDLAVLRRGLDGARLGDIVARFDALAGRFRPARLVVFAGSNDLVPGGDTEPWDVLDGVARLLAAAGKLQPAPDVIWIEITPTPRRAAILDAVLTANRLVGVLATRRSNLHVLTAAEQFLDARGQPDPQWFVDDGLHLNARGYALWRTGLKALLSRLA